MFAPRPRLFALLLALAALSHSAAVAQVALALPATTESVASIKTEKGAVATLVTEGGAPALKVEFPAGPGYPGINFPLGGPTLDLSAHAGIELELTNTGPERLNLNVRVDNAGDWKLSPWNTESGNVEPGQTRVFRVRFGRSHGQPAYALDPRAISAIKLFAANPKVPATIVVKRLAPLAASAAAPAPTANSAKPAAKPATVPTGVDATFSPPISGELVDLAKAEPLAGFKFNGSSATVADGKIVARFSAGSGYPAVYFPIPEGGWNLSHFGGVQVAVHNPGAERVRVYLRVDNPRTPGFSEPWNTYSVLVGPGETRPIKLLFGQNNGAPAFPLNPARVKAVQVFLSKPKADTVLHLSDIRAWGSPAAADANAALTQPSDRDTPVTPPAWLGQRPPVEGDWVQTLNENFDGTALDEKLWTPRFPWDGLAGGQLQRYDAKNVTVGDGVARFVVEHRPGHHNDDPTKPTRPYASGLIQSYDKWTQLYGYLEARIKMPTTRGLWPAFWTMPDRGAATGLDLWKRRSTSKGGMEIDILEHLCEWGPGRYNVAAHWDDYGPNHQAWGTSQLYHGPTADGFHAFGVLWEPGKLTWFVDGKKTAVWENARVGSVASYLKLNIQVGGWATKDVDNARLPDAMVVDWVRVWQLRERLPAP